MKKGELMLRALESKILCGGYGPGERLPSLRLLMQQYRLSLNTVRRSVARLAARGLVEFRHGSGTYVARTRRLPAGARFIAVSVRLGGNGRTSFSGAAFNGACRAAERAGIDLRHVALEGKDCSDAVVEKLAAECDGLLLFGGYDEFLQTPRLRIPTVGVGFHRSFDGLFSLIDLDPVRAAELSCEFFRRRGQSRVAAIGLERANLRFRHQLFAAQFSGMVTAVPARCAVEFSPECGYLYYSGARALEDAAAWRAATGRDPAAEFDLLCIDGKPMLANAAAPIPTVAINWHLAGEAAVEECLRRYTAPGSVARRIYFSPELYDIQQ